MSGVSSIPNADGAMGSTVTAAAAAGMGDGQIMTSSNTTVAAWVEELLTTRPACIGPVTGI